MVLVIVPPLRVPFDFIIQSLLISSYSLTALFAAEFADVEKTLDFNPINALEISWGYFSLN